MTHAIVIGETSIPYVVHHRAVKRKRMVVTPEGVEVIVPQGTAIDGPGGVAAFVNAKRRWLFNAKRDIDARHRARRPQLYGSGAKLQYKGRNLMMKIQEGDVPGIEVECRSRFHITVPRGTKARALESDIPEALDTWLKGRAHKDIAKYRRRHEGRLGVEAKGHRVVDTKANWGHCGRDGIIRIHWGLIQAPAAAMEYVVAHELTHLIHRNHSDAFWGTLSVTLPDWRERKAMLEAWEG